MAQKEYKKEFNVIYLTSPATRLKTSNALRKKNRKTLDEFEGWGSKKEILNKLKHISQISNKPLTSQWVEDKYPSFYRTSSRSFGSFAKMMQVSGLEYNPITKWTEKKIGFELRKLPDLSDSYVNKNFSSLYTTAREKYGSWKATLEHFGYDYSKIRKRMKSTIEDIQEELINLHKKHGTLTYKLVHGESDSLIQAIVKQLTNLEQACKTFGLPFENLHVSWNEKRINEEYQELVKTLKHIPTRLEIINKYPRLWNAIYRYYGNYGKFKESL